MLIRIFFLCVYQHEALASRARNQQELDQEIPPKRGIIYIQEKGGLFNPLATNREYQKIFLVPKEVVNKEEAAQQLADILKIDREEILIKLQDSDSQYKPIQYKVDNETSQAVKNKRRLFRKRAVALVSAR